MTKNPLNGKQCTNCQQIMFPNRLFCKNCRSTKLEDYELPTKGKIYSFTTVHYPLSHYDNPPYYVGLVTFDSDDVIITARIESSDEEKISINQEVELSVKTFSESGSLSIVVAKII
ncbi:MAG: Zn-ribbon domain-containing OB-fold protein [Candidatus Hodarchaeales archaeon]|jgi:uncharacterized OB-fold protein